RCRLLLARLAERGYAVATAHYRLPGKYRFPAPVEDSKAAVRWLRANASRYGLDARRVGVVGFSAGAYGACMLGTTRPAGRFGGRWRPPRRARSRPGGGRPRRPGRPPPKAGARGAGPRLPPAFLGPPLRRRPGPLRARPAGRLRGRRRPAVPALPLARRPR